MFFFIFVFFFNDTATTEIYTLSLHDALPIWSDLSHADRHGVECGSRRLSGATARCDSYHLGLTDR